MISVIVPVYNLEKYIARTLDSILAQTYKDLEIIAVDDGSTDDTAKILDEYAIKNKDIHVFHIPNGGVTNARLSGVKFAKGEWIGFVDGDDWIEPNMYERLLTNAEKFSATISHCGYCMIFDDGRVHYFYNTGCLIQQDKTKGLRDLLDGTKIEPGLCNKLFHKTLLQRLLDSNAMLTDVKINEDLLMNFLLFSYSTKSVYEDFCPYHYIVRHNSASRQKINSNKINDPIRVKEQILAIAPKELICDAQRAYLSTCINVSNSIVLSGQNEFDKDWQRVRKNVISHYQWRTYLSKRQKLLARMIRYVPQLYFPLYRFYASHYMKNPYV